MQLRAFFILFFVFIGVFHLETAFAGKNLYQLLDVSPKATQDEIKKAYRKQISLHHPDRFSLANVEERKLHEEISKEINNAYEILSNTNARAAYDRAAPQVQPKPQPQADQVILDYMKLMRLMDGLSEDKRVEIGLQFLEKRFPFSNNLFVDLAQMNAYLKFSHDLWYDKIFKMELSNGDLRVIEASLIASMAYLKKIHSVHQPSYEKAYTDLYAYYYEIHERANGILTPHQRLFKYMIARSLNFLNSTRDSAWMTERYATEIKQKNRMCKALFQNL